MPVRYITSRSNTSNVCPSVPSVTKDNVVENGVDTTPNATGVLFAINATKQARPVWAYLLPGIALGSIGAFVYNVIGTITED